MAAGDWSGIKFAEDWGEAAGFVALITGLLLGLLTGSQGVAWLGSFLAGLGLGVWCYRSRKGRRLHLYVVTGGFLAGYMLGCLAFTPPKGIIALFALGFILGYWIKKTRKK